MAATARDSSNLTMALEAYRKLMIYAKMSDGRTALMATLTNCYKQCTLLYIQKFF
jgi:hypothetical protein